MRVDQKFEDIDECAWDAQDAGAIDRSADVQAGLQNVRKRACEGEEIDIAR